MVYTLSRIIYSGRIMIIDHRLCTYMMTMFSNYTKSYFFDEMLVINIIWYKNTLYCVLGQSKNVQYKIFISKTHHFDIHIVKLRTVYKKCIYCNINTYSSINSIKNYVYRFIRSYQNYMYKCITYTE